MKTMPKHSRRVVTKHVGKLVKPNGKVKKAQSFAKKIFELPMGSPSNFSLQNLMLSLLSMGYIYYIKEPK